MFTIALPDNRSKSYQTRDAAVQFADTKSVELHAELEVVDTETGTVVFMASPVRGRHFNPWERVETPKHAAPHFEGFYPAYTRARIGATVYRAYDGEVANPWRVFDGRTGKHRDVKTTRAACILTREMRQGLHL